MSTAHFPSPADDKDAWLGRWLPLLGEPSSAAILELGCDSGRDTAWLARHGFSVTATDIAPEGLQATAAAVPSARLVAHDLQTPFPFADHSVDAVIASLCLHYFPWSATRDMVYRIGSLLKPGGILLCRLNSTRDENHGAVGFREIEPNYYEVNGRYGVNKRFFDRAAVDALFDDWEVISAEERTVDRYDTLKMAWEVVLKKRPQQK